MFFVYHHLPAAPPCLTVRTYMRVKQHEIDRFFVCVLLEKTRCANKIVLYKDNQNYYLIPAGKIKK
jgi:hypothetical protein